MSGDGKRGVGQWPQAIAPIFDSTTLPIRCAAAIMSGYRGTCTVAGRHPGCVLVISAENGSAGTHSLRSGECGGAAPTAYIENASARHACSAFSLSPICSVPPASSGTLSAPAVSLPSLPGATLLRACKLGVLGFDCRPETELSRRFNPWDRRNRRHCARSLPQAE